MIADWRSAVHHARSVAIRTGDAYDVFLSHASEDKAEVVVPLAEALAARGVRVWLDRQQLTLGDSLSRRIDEGLTQSRFGVVVLSPSFFAKEWPQRELDGKIEAGRCVLRAGGWASAAVRWRRSRPELRRR